MLLKKSYDVCAEHEMAAISYRVMRTKSIVTHDALNRIEYCKEKSIAVSLNALHPVTE